MYCVLVISLCIVLYCVLYDSFPQIPQRPVSRVFSHPGEPEAEAPEEDPMIRAAKETAKAKKERKEAAVAAKTKAKAARQYHPEVKVEVGP